MTPAAPASSQPERPDAFVSYSRHDGEFVGALVRALEARGKDVWVDLDDIPKSADWHARVEQGIEASKAVVVVLSPALAASQICGEEIRHAIEHNKRLIPILRTDVEPEQLYPELNAPNWILARDQDDQDAAFEELIQALETDLAWLEVHARLVARSVEWDRQNRDGSFLLRGDDLKTAQRWLAGRAEHREQPTELQVSYIGASRRSALVRRTVVGVAALGVLALAGFLLVQRDRTQDEQEKARKQERLAESRRLSADSVVQLDTQSREALATAVKAHAAAPTPEATQALRQALMRPRRESTLSVPRGSIWSGNFIDAKTVRVRLDDGRILRWPLDGGDPVVLGRGEPPQIVVNSPPDRAANLVARPEFDRVRVTTITKGTVVVLDELGPAPAGEPRTAALSPDGGRVLTAGYRAAADVWRVPAVAIRPPGGARAGCAAAAGAYVVTCDNRGRVAIWSPGASRPRHTIQAGPGDEFQSPDLDIGVSTDGTLGFATSQRRGTVTVIDATSGKVVRTLRGRSYQPPLLSGNGQRLYLPREPKPVIRDASSKAVIATFPFRNSDFFRPPLLDSTGERIATYPGDGVRVWDVATGTEIAKLPRPEDQLDAYALSPSGRYVATALARRVSVYESDGGSPVVDYPVDERIDEMKFSRDDAFILTAGGETARVAELKTGRRVATFGGHRRGVQGASFGPGARTILTVGRDGVALVHDCPACAAAPVLVKRARAALRAGG